jgi:hypothetical protein
MFYEFSTSRVQAKTKEEILLGKPFTQAGHTYFRMSDFIKFLDRQRFTLFKLNEIISTLRDEHDLAPYVFRVSGKNISCFRVTSPDKIEIDVDSLPKMTEEEEAV